MTRQHTLAFLVIAAAWSLAALPSAATPAQTAVGEAFPDLVLPTVDGQQTVRLSDHRGKRVLLIEFASW